VYGDLGFWFMARLRMLYGVGLPMIFVPIMAASFDGIDKSKTDQASAIINAARNTGGSIGEVCYRCWNLRPVTILVNERPDGTHVSHGMLANLPAFYDDRTPLLSRGILDSKIENLLRESTADGIAAGR
jgi:hypothetical protein